EAVAERARRHHWDGVYPKSLITLLGRRPAAVLAPLMTMVIVCELALPFGLSLREVAPYAICAGATMHAAFTWLFPGTLTHFSLLTVSSSLLFLDPSAVAAWILRRT